MTTETTPGQSARIEAAITAKRMERVDACDWASPAVRDILAEYAADLREAIPLSVGLDRIRRAIEADRASRDGQAVDEPAVRLVS